MGKTQLEQLDKYGMYISVPIGNSMLPMLRGGQDAVEVHSLKRRPKRYDVVLYVKPDMQGVIHRVLGWKNDVCIICGDNNLKKEYVPEDMIHGIVTGFYRAGRWHSVDELGYRIYARLWTDFYVFRKSYFRVRGWFHRFIVNRNT